MSQSATPPLERIKERIVQFEKAQKNLEGYEDGSLALPNNMFDRYETCLYQKDVLKRLFNEVLFEAMALERVNALPVELSEKIAEMRINP
jgi:hypothetical protein